jgi:hypothetical protein
LVVWKKGERRKGKRTDTRLYVAEENRQEEVERESREREGRSEAA